MTSAVIGFSAAGPFGRQWLPVASSADVQDSPAAARLLGRNLVLWRSPSAAVVAAPDLCTHSKGDLTKGEVNEGLLVCPKHGWTFGDEGRCVFKPSGLSINDKAHLKIHACTERYGLIWVSLNEPAAPLIDLAWDGDAVHRRIHSSVSVWNSNPIRIVETLLARANSPFDDVTADIPFVVQGTSKSDGAQHRRLVSCAPIDSRHSMVATVVWTTNDAHGDGAKVVDEATADLDDARSAAESGTVLTPSIDIALDEDTGSADWKRRLLAFVGQASD
ncbi:Rieske 2Fe-2S domain-containing protein [Mycobacterium sp. SMC-2]|uniref:Rieske 2Fe-2S domain-containing protein n=1 Tax=Mycobacterium sp. SMC-2 TaxID=2857058 RepID=UPI0021B3B73E|nr:Rieske 2Fe-2S domain-containing protein [Mycobacterium sp. SMC-2]UXA05404.1 Rieske 2Fe-2S domain-containing protein [Mycobacterium sp. SMC-2]